MAIRLRKNTHPGLIHGVGSEYQESAHGFRLIRRQQHGRNFHGLLEPFSAVFVSGHGSSTGGAFTQSIIRADGPVWQNLR
jgi:hypothetical protein